MSDCQFAVTELINLLESGGTPFPIFFTNPNCEANGLQFPSSGNVLPLNLFNQTLDFRSYPGTCTGDTIQDCPLPAIQSMIVPTGFNVTVTTLENDTINNIVLERGQYTIKSQDFALNIYNVNLLPTSDQKWGSALNNGLACTNESQKFDSLYADANEFGCTLPENKMTTTNLSCGGPFWPSFLGVANAFNGLTPVNEMWQTCRNGTDELLGGTFCNQVGNMVAPGNPTWGNLAMATYRRRLFGPTSCFDTTGGNPQYSTCDCLADSAQVCQAGGQGFCDCQLVDDACDTNGRCFCENPVSGNAQNVKIEFDSTTTWFEQQIDYCLGRAKLSVGGIDVQRYGNGTPACDQLVTQFCSNTANLNNPANVKSCSCILEQKRIEAQFAGLDLPVQCFSDVCNNDDPQVYRTQAQQQGCSARLCVQTLNIAGSAIASEGFQTLTCDGTTYNISTLPSATPVPIVTPNLSSGSLELGPLFYISLGILVLMVILIVTYFIRRVIVSRKRKKLARQQLTYTLEQDIS